METRAVSELRCSTASLCLRVFRWAAQALDDRTDLWQAWGRPEIWRLPHGHISVLLAWPVLERTVQWLVRKAQAR